MLRVSGGVGKVFSRRDIIHELNKLHYIKIPQTRHHHHDAKQSLVLKLSLLALHNYIVL